MDGLSALKPANLTFKKNYDTTVSFFSSILWAVSLLYIPWKSYFIIISYIKREFDRKKWQQKFLPIRQKIFLKMK